MALAATLLAHGVNGGNPLTSWSSGSFTPSSNVILVAFTGAIDMGSGDISGSFTVSGGSLTYTSRATAGVSSSFRMQARVWTAPIATSPGSMSLSFGLSSGQCASARWAVYEVSGYDTGSPVGSNAGTASTVDDGSLTITLSGAPATDSIVLAFMGVDGDSTGTVAVTPGTGWTEDAENGSTADFGYSQVQHRTGSTSTSVTWDDIRAGTMPVYSSVGIAVETKAAAGGPTTLIVADLTSTSALDAVALTQHHVLVVNDMSSGSPLDSPVLTQHHVLAVADSTSAPTLDSPTLTQHHVLTVADLASSTASDSVALTQHHVLQVADMVSGSTLDPVVLVAAGTLAVADMTSAATLDPVALTQQHALVVNDLVSATTLDAVNLGLSIELTVQDLASASTMDTVDVAQTHHLTVTDLTSGTTLSQVVLTQLHRLLVNDMASASTLDFVVLLGNGPVITGPLTMVTLSADRTLTTLTPNRTITSTDTPRTMETNR